MQSTLESTRIAQSCPLVATGLSPKSNSGGQSATPQATSSAFITNFPDNPKKICIKDPAVQGSAKHHGEIYFSFDRVFWTECSQEEIFQVVASLILTAIIVFRPGKETEAKGHAFHNLSFREHSRMSLQSRTVSLSLFISSQGALCY